MQQVLDELEKDGVLTGIPDKTAARARQLIPTEASLATLRDADRIKTKIEARWPRTLGGTDFDQLDAMLRLPIEG